MHKDQVIVYRWGYDQTNVEFYTIIKRTSNYVMLQKMIVTEIEIKESMSGYCVPDRFSNKVIRKKVITSEFGECVKFDFGIGKVWNGEPMSYSYYA